MTAPAGPRRLRLLVTVTFNDNQLRSHLLPMLALDEVEEIVLVADRRPAPLPRVRVVVPPRLLVRLLGRALAKLVVCVRVARRERPDWVIGFNLAPHGLNAIATARLARSKSLYQMIGGSREWDEGGWQSDNGVFGRLRRPAPRLERALVAAVRRSTLVAAMGERGRAELIARGVDPERAVVVPPAVETDRFASGPEREARYDLITVGALLATKRVGDLLQAASRLLPDNPELRIAVVGEGPLDAELRTLAAELGLAGNVDFLGFRADVEKLYAEAKVFVLPSGYEGLSIAMLEAMASGLPVAVADVGELGSFVRDGVSGVLYPPGDVEALAAELAALLGAPERRASLGAAARHDVVERVSVEAVAGIYRDVLSNRRGAADTSGDD